jgi:succinate dehydrogenase / fumarate reductase membrane anchor subunit
MVGPNDRLAVGAHYGLADWLSQRVTAIVITLYTLLWLGIALWNGGIDHALFTALFAGTAFRIATFLFMVALLLHAWVGVRNIAIDYLKPTALRLTFQSAVILVLLAYAAWTIQLLWAS